MCKTTLAPGLLLRSVHMEKSYLSKAVTRCCTSGNPPLEVTPGQQKAHVNSYRRQTMHRGKVDPGVSELPRGNELSRDHVNRPLMNACLNLSLSIIQSVLAVSPFIWSGFYQVIILLHPIYTGKKKLET